MTCLLVVLAQLALHASASSSAVFQEAEDSACNTGVHLLQSSSLKRPNIHRQEPKTGESGQINSDAIPFSSLVESSQSSHPVILNQIQEVVKLAQTRVQTKVGEAPYFIIAVAIGGFALSLLSICVSLIFVNRDLSKDGNGLFAEPTASALLAQRLRALGMGDAGRNRWERHPARTWEHAGNPGPSKPAVMADGQSRHQIVVQEPLEGGKVGLNLSEDDLVVNNFGDLRAYDLGFRIGDRLVQVNQVPVFREADFRFAMQDALRRNTERREPIVFHVMRRPASQSMSAPTVPQQPQHVPQHAPQHAPQHHMAAPTTVPGSGGEPGPGPSMQDLPGSDQNGDLRGSWVYGDKYTDDLYTYVIRQVGPEMCFEQTLPNREKITGMLVHDGMWLRSNLQSKEGFYGELRMQYDPEEKVLVSQLKRKDETKWSSDILARRAGSGGRA